MPQTETAPLTAAGLPSFAIATHGSRRALRVKGDGVWRDRSYAEVAEEIERLATGFIVQGIEPGDRVCILADTRPEWSVASYALWTAGAVVVPIYPSNSAEECAWVAGNSGAVAVIVEDAAQRAKIDTVREALPALRSLFVIEGRDAVDGVTAFDELAASGGEREELSRRRDAVGPDDVALIIYTSGTTGPPKGCVLTHRNAMSLCSIVLEIETLRPGEVAYLYLPLAHVFAQIVQLAAFQVGAAIAYYGGDTKQIIPELIEVHPDYLPSVPRIFEKLYALAMSQVPPEEQDDVARAVNLGVQVRGLEARGEPVPDEMRGPFERADERIFSKVRALFGGRLREALTGAAPIAPEILEFFYASGVPVMEGYGMSETMAIGTVNRQESFRFGTVGRALPGLEVRIADDGEILIRGPHLFGGYYLDPAATREALSPDGWLRTGDLGQISAEGFVSVTGRKKDLIITSSGKNITPVNIENQLRESRFVTEAIVYGDNQPYLVAALTLDPEEAGKVALRHGTQTDRATLAADPDVRAELQKEVDAVNARLARIEQVKRFAILDTDLSQAGGELTPTLKVKRAIVYEKYADVFTGLYAKEEQR